MIKTVVILIACALSMGYDSLVAQSDTSTSSIANLLPGTWVYQSQVGEFIETWWVESVDHLKGRGHFVKNGDTLFTEKLNLYLVEDRWCYIAIPEGANPTLFYRTQSRDNSWDFENPEHDFPQRISYQFTGREKLTAIVSGQDQKGSHSSQTYSYTRVD